ncbi:hypothetical protein B9479_001410 [Cryptococcus floricola]|uniref:Uncharacterized protein n=1 Tax=Cryptococcus floricola TaxID=2591691 RepID=A0A5D3B6G1_9TREE|nr:hypothetical protein B9479_001410 [Cryptococcus floricola]
MPPQRPSAPQTPASKHSRELKPARTVVWIRNPLDILADAVDILDRTSPPRVEGRDDDVLAIMTSLLRPHTLHSVLVSWHPRPLPASPSASTMQPSLPYLLPPPTTNPPDSFAVPRST